MAYNLIGLGRSAVMADPAVKIDYWMNCFFFSKHSQSRFAYGNVVSLPKLVQLYGDSAIELKEHLQIQLRNFLEKPFTRADVAVGIEEAEGGYGLTLDVNVSDHESVHVGAINVGYALTVRDSVLRSILESNGGRVLYDFPN